MGELENPTSRNVRGPGKKSRLAQISSQVPIGVGLLHEDLWVLLRVTWTSIALKSKNPLKSSPHGSGTR